MCIRDSLPPAAAAAIRLGGILSGAALVLAAVTGAAAAVIWIAARFGKRFSLVEKGVAAVKKDVYKRQCSPS